MTENTYEVPSCPFCEACATVSRLRNVDELRVDHAKGCWLQDRLITRFHWGDGVPEKPFEDWCTRAPVKL